MNRRVSGLVTMEGKEKPRVCEGGEGNKEHRQFRGVVEKEKGFREKLGTG